MSRRDAERYTPDPAAVDVAKRRIRFLLTEWALALHKSSLEGMLANAYLQGVIDCAEVVARRNQEEHMRLRPLSDYVLVKREPEKTKTEGGLFIPEAAKSKTDRGEVLAVGPGAFEGGKRIEPQVKVGDVVLLPKYGGQGVDGDESTILVRESELLGVVE